MSSKKNWGTEIQTEYTFFKPTTLCEIAGVLYETILEKQKETTMESIMHFKHLKTLQSQIEIE